MPTTPPDPPVPDSPQPNAEALAARVAAVIAPLGRVLVAFSGGVDSTVVMKAACLTLGAEALAVTARSESTTDEDEAVCREIAAEHGFRHEVIAYSELAVENYASNPANRCFFCKNELYTRLSALAIERGIPYVCDGSNLDDAGDWRPGLKAVAQHGVRSPLREAGLDKAAVRRLAAWYELPNHDRPANPCLSSRIPYGSMVTKEKLDQVAQAERLLRNLGLREVRCRHHGPVARLEVNPDDFSVVLQHRDAILAGLRMAGFQWVALDLAGFRSGSLNALIRPESLPGGGVADNLSSTQ